MKVSNTRIPGDTLSGIINYFFSKSFMLTGKQINIISKLVNDQGIFSTGAKNKFASIGVCYILGVFEKIISGAIVQRAVAQFYYF